MLHHIISKQRPYLSKWALLLTLGFATLFLFPESAYAAEAGGGDMWAVGKELIINLYNKIAGISTVLAAHLDCVGGHQRHRRVYRLYPAAIQQRAEDRRVLKH